MLSKSSFENKLLVLALFTGLLPTTLLFIILYGYDLSIYLKIMLMFFMLVSVSYCAFAIRQKVTFQLRTSANLITAMQSGDHSLKAHQYSTTGALSEFNQVFNELSSALAEQQLIGKEKQVLLHKVIAQIDVAIIAVDERSNIALMNPSAEKLFSCRFDEVQGWPIKTLGLQDVLAGEYRKVVEFKIKEYKKQVYIHTDEYFEKGIRQQLIFITDIQHLLREEERQAWQKILRVLSHEINNSLAPIASISETLTRLLANNRMPFDNNTELGEKLSGELSDDLREGLAVITERANSLNSFLQRYQQLSQLPTPDKKVFDCEPLLKSMALLFSDSNIQFNGSALFVHADEEQIQQVFVNLVKNAQQAMVGGNQREIVISWRQRAERVEILIEDEGTGINNTDNLFIPFYTTKEEGSGIGLVLSRQIIINHGGDLTINNRVDKEGVKATIYLPASNVFSQKHTVDN
ncbi:MAG: two-component system nitrogen regulation sensor histidine kinase NtrY [Alteromonadaceae bacterium]|jgi:two-component system nitrogen regulation sensor histidine kinase NtrY